MPLVYCAFLDCHDTKLNIAELAMWCSTSAYQVSYWPNKRMGKGLNCLLHRSHHIYLWWQQVALLGKLRGGQMALQTLYTPFSLITINCAKLVPYTVWVDGTPTGENLFPVQGVLHLATSLWGIFCRSTLLIVLNETANLQLLYLALHYTNDWAFCVRELHNKQSEMKLNKKKHLHVQMLLNKRAIQAQRRWLSALPASQWTPSITSPDRSS